MNEQTHAPEGSRGGAPAPERIPPPRNLGGPVRAVARVVRGSGVVRVWALKAAVQKAISLMPASHRVNELFQRHVTGGVELNERFLEDRLIHLRNHLSGYRQVSGRACPDSTLELGTGWYPLVPIALFLAGANTIWSVDVAPLVRRERVAATAGALLDMQASGALHQYVLAEDDRVRTLEGLRRDAADLSAGEMLARLGIRLLVTDARRLPLPDGSVDLIHSNNTLEHIPAPVLEDVLREFVRVAAPGCVMSHFIDMSDHFSHLDRSITIYNFLRFSQRAWRLIDNGVQPQNRLRHRDYLAMYARLGLPVVRESHRPGDLEALLATPLHAGLAGRDPVELAISHCHLWSVVPRAAEDRAED